PTGSLLRRRRRLFAALPAPWLLKPIRLRIALSRTSRNRRGVGLPGWGDAVTVPTSLNPKPIAPHESTAAAFLSKPAASPSGPGNRRPSTSCDRIGSRTPRTLRTRAPSGGTRVNSLSRPNTRWWIRSAGKRNSTLLISGYTVLLGRTPGGAGQLVGVVRSGSNTWRPAPSPEPTTTAPESVTARASGCRTVATSARDSPSPSPRSYARTVLVPVEVTHTRPLAGSSATAHGAEGTGNIWWRRTGEVEYTSSVSPTVSLATTDPLENVLSMPAPLPARRSGPACSSSRSMLASTVSGLLRAVTDPSRATAMRSIDSRPESRFSSAPSASLTTTSPSAETAWFRSSGVLGAVATGPSPVRSRSGPDGGTTTTPSECGTSTVPSRA